MNVLIACEESQTVCIEFRKRGHRAFSCDLEDCSGGHPEWHIKEDCLKVINGNCTFKTVDTHTHTQRGQWDLIIAHPPCTYLAVSGNRWFSVKRYGTKALERAGEREKAAQFFMKVAGAGCDRIAIENPVGYMSSFYRPADQYIQPWMFGEPYEKLTCLWLKNLPQLKPTKIVEPPKRKVFDSGKTMATWYADLYGLSKSERAKARSKTFKGIAEAMADQWQASQPIQLSLF